MLMLRGRINAAVHGLKHFSSKDHGIWRAMVPVTFWQHLLSGGTAADVAGFCECGEVFEDHSSRLPTQPSRKTA